MSPPPLTAVPVAGHCSYTDHLFSPVFHVCGPFLRSHKTCWEQCGAPLVCTVLPLLPCPATPTAASVVPPIQNDQDISLQTCNVFKWSRLEIYQKVYSNRADGFYKNVHACNALPGWTMSVSAKRVFLWHFCHDKISLRLFWESFSGFKKKSLRNCIFCLQILVVNGSMSKFGYIL